MAGSSASVSASRSRARSHCAIWWSSPLLANTLESSGCHSTLVTGPEWWWKLATGSLRPLNCLRSQTLTTPSSPPDTRNGSFLFQSITFTSELCAPPWVSMQALPGSALMSQILMVLSQLQLAITVFSLGLHLTSSTYPVCDEYGLSDTAH